LFKISSNLFQKGRKMDTSRRNFLKASTATGLLAMTYAPGTLGAVGAKALEGGDKATL